MQKLACRAGKICASERTVYFFIKSLAALDFNAVEGWGEKEISTKGVDDRQEEG